MFRLWNRIVRMAEDRLPKLIMKYEHDSVFHNWTKEMGTLMRKLGLHRLYHEKSVCDISMVKSQLFKLNQDTWKIDLINKPKLRNYTRYKTEYGTENYVKYVNHKLDRSIIAKLRCGILKLKVETGRFTNMPLADRICDLCDTGFVEDEIHFVCVCPKYMNERRTYYNYLDNRSDHDFKTIQNKPHSDIFDHILKYADRNTAQYVSCIWEMRTNAIFV